MVLLWCFDLISCQEKILKHKYSSMLDMEDDMSLLFQNARIFNEEGSQVREPPCELSSTVCFVVRFMLIQLNSSVCL